MGQIPQKTLKDLEFFEVLQQVSDFASTNLGKQACLRIHPIESKDKRIKQLKRVSEYQLAFTNNNQIPEHQFVDAQNIIVLLRIDNSILSTEDLRNLASNTNKSNSLLRFFDRYKVIFPELHSLGENLTVNDEIEKIVDKQIDRFNQIRDDASLAMIKIRHQIRQNRLQIDKSFNVALNQYASKGYLDRIKESVFDGRRVLAVKSMFRKKIKGTALGSSKNQTIVFMEPEENGKLFNEYKNLRFEETEEEKVILKELTNRVRNFVGLFNAQQKFFIELDVISASAKYADSIAAVLPQFTQTQSLSLKRAFHPLLLTTNRQSKLPTIPQNIELNTDRRIIVISGPNAGGKSITLKTVGLLQLMIQSGLLIPVEQNSICGFFDQILTDIGDNQSIENHLSTYSYRMKNMRELLKKSNPTTLFLIDEFGTGSDPDLGGALAEAILEVIYQTEAYGIITTHYSNLKLLAQDLPNMINANMLFDKKSLEPLYKLEIGDAGSSFTFEVAQKIGIPFSIINKAKKKISRDKLKFDETLSKLQNEKSILINLKKELKEKEQSYIEKSYRLENTNQKLEKKLQDFQILYDENQRILNLGKTFNKLLQSYSDQPNKRKALEIVIETLNKQVKKHSRYNQKNRINVKWVEKRLKRDLDRIEKTNFNETPQPKKQKKVEFKEGDNVRIRQGEAVGIIEVLEKGQATINYGKFRTKVDVETIELVLDEKS